MLHGHIQTDTGQDLTITYSVATDLVSCMFNGIAHFVYKGHYCMLLSNLDLCLSVYDHVTSGGF
jgi:hypothetical protein